MPHRDGCDDRQLFPGRSARAKRAGADDTCLRSQPSAVSVNPPRTAFGSPPFQGRLAWCGPDGAHRSGARWPLHAADRLDRRRARASASGKNTRSAALSGRYLCSPPPSGRAAVVGHWHPLARTSGRATWRGVASCETENGRPLEPMRAGSMFAIRRLSMCVGAPARPLAGPAMNSRQIREHAIGNHPRFESPRERRAELPKAFRGASLR
jgi:hypothetical protein